jgi:hypothetical protein
LFFKFFSCIIEYFGTLFALYRMSVNRRHRVICPEICIVREFIMKKTILPVIFAIALAGLVSAQGFNAPGPGRGPGFGPMAQNQATPPAAPALETLEGKLELVNAAPAIQVGSKTYYVRLPGKLFGFIDGLKEGVQVKIEGYAFPIPSAKDSFGVHVQKLTFGGRTIDFSAGIMAGKGMPGGMQRGMPGQMMSGSCGQNGMRGKGMQRGNRKF